jgi:NitT/TauT family transport system substrate-binding protein
MINDLVSTVLYNKDQIQLQIVRFARTATPEFPQYRILAAPNSGIETAADLKGVPIGVSEASVIAYTTDRLLQAEGLQPEDIQTLAVPRIPDRLALLASGELKAANMPDPFSLLAIQGGATVIVDDSKYPQYGNSVYSLRRQRPVQRPAERAEARPRAGPRYLHDPRPARRLHPNPRAVGRRGGLDPGERPGEPGCGL